MAKKKRVCTVVEGRVETDHAARASLKRRISGHASGARRFKVGITNNPEARAKKQDYVNTYDELIPLFRSRSINTVRNIEADLVDFYEDRYDNDNKIGGGGGGVGSPPYYVYVVMRY